MIEWAKRWWNRQAIAEAEAEKCRAALREHEQHRAEFDEWCRENEARVQYVNGEHLRFCKRTYRDRNPKPEPIQIPSHTHAYGAGHGGGYGGTIQIPIPGGAGGAGVGGAIQFPD